MTEPIIVTAVFGDETDANAVQLTVAPPVNLTNAEPEPITVEVVGEIGVPVTLINAEPESVTVETAGEIGPPGPTGPRGLVGPVGPPGGGFYRHVQSVPVATWVIDHALGCRPAVSVEDSAGTVIEGDVTYPDEFTVVVAFSAATGGYANLS